MKVTGIGLLLMGGILLMFSLFSYLTATAPTATNPEKQFFEPIYSLAMGLASAAAGGAVLMFGGRGYTEEKMRPANVKNMM